MKGEKQMKVLDLITKLQKAYQHYGNVDVITTELQNTMDICEPDDSREIEDVDGIPCGEGAIVLKLSKAEA